MDAADVIAPDVLQGHRWTAVLLLLGPGPQVSGLLPHRSPLQDQAHIGGRPRKDGASLPSHVRNPLGCFSTCITSRRVPIISLVIHRVFNTLVYGVWGGGLEAVPTVYVNKGLPVATVLVSNGMVSSAVVTRDRYVRSVQHSLSNKYHFLVDCCSTCDWGGGGGRERFEPFPRSSLVELR